MARDPRKASAFDSGMRGSQKNKGGRPSMAGAPSGLSAYDSGMRGPEKPAATSQTPGGILGNPDGDKPNPGGQPNSAITSDPTLQAHTSDAYGLTGGSSTESAAVSAAPTVEEDDQHINIKVPKSMLGHKKK